MMTKKGKKPLFFNTYDLLKTISFIVHYSQKNYNLLTILPLPP